MLDETELPKKSVFNSRLTGKHISDKDYNQAKEIWRTFNCQTIGNYSDIYFKTDVLQMF